MSGGQEDLYGLLGVDRKADVKEIRSAYKDLCKIHHPDKGGNEETFKKISHAHEILTDSQRRDMYDMTGSVQEGGGGPQGPPGGFPVGFPFGFGGGGVHMNVDINDIFGHMFGGGGGNRGWLRVPSKKHKNRFKNFLKLFPNLKDKV
jgi:DnaJ-class molecular chaperone